ncbi:helix-turn-helix domain-containing protein [Actinoplanes xinjiangensis]|uniref:helix-turn-helix domain-containing protein n=1 Tax=Actinoplanes xinjiangensis TaxID=512350 RepID=UPI003F4E2F0E
MAPPSTVAVSMPCSSIELQRELIVANTRDGLAAARTRGRKGGRRPRLSAHQAEVAQQLYDGGRHTVQQIADMFGVPRSTVYGHLDKTRIGARPVVPPTGRAARLAALPVDTRPPRDLHQYDGLLHRHPTPAARVHAGHDNSTGTVAVWEASTCGTGDQAY